MLRALRRHWNTTDIYSSVVNVAFSIQSIRLFWTSENSILTRKCFLRCSWCSWHSRHQCHTVNQTIPINEVWTLGVAEITSHMKGWSIVWMFQVSIIWKLLSFGVVENYHTFYFSLPVHLSFLYRGPVLIERKQMLLVTPTSCWAVRTDSSWRDGIYHHWWCIIRH